MKSNKKYSEQGADTQKILHKRSAEAFLRGGHCGRVFLFLALLFFLSIFFFPFEKTVCIRNRAGYSERVYSAKALKGFCIAYTHSVNKGRVRDYYRLHKKRFIVYKTEFTSYGAGMPELQETPGAVFKTGENTFAMEYERDAGEKFLLAVGVIANHSITIDGEEFFLTDFFAPQTSLEFFVKRISIAEKIGGKKWTTQTKAKL